MRKIITAIEARSHHLYLSAAGYLVVTEFAHGQYMYGIVLAMLSFHYEMPEKDLSK